MPLPAYDFELAISGLCMFDLTATGATVLLVNASDPTRFVRDPDLASLAPDSFPNPHFPRFSYLMSQQIRNEDDLPGNLAPRLPQRVFSGLSGEEIGVCDLKGEDVTLVAPAGAPAFSPGALTGAHSLSSLVSATGSSLNNAALATRFQLSNGHLETLRLSFVGDVLLEIDFQKISEFGQNPTVPKNIADQLILRVKDLQEPVEIASNTRGSIFLRPDPDASGTGVRPVVASLSNFHEAFHTPQDAAYDFLWFYELLSFAGTRPSRLDLPIPVYLNGDSRFTGSSGVCPPIKF